jgi:hypothetical protein
LSLSCASQTKTIPMADVIHRLLARMTAGSTRPGSSNGLWIVYNGLESLQKSLTHPMNDPRRNSYEIGHAGELRVERVTGGRLVPGSGGGKFLKLDVRDRLKFVWSVKSSNGHGTAGLRELGKLWREAISGTRGFAGHGDGAKPGLVFTIDGDLIACMRLEDLMEIVRGEAEITLPSDKADQRRQKGRKSFLE